MDLLESTIERLKAFEPPEGYYGAFSGGKDSQVLYETAKLAGVKVDWHFHRTSVDPPQLLAFIRRNYPEVIWDKPEKTMFQLILKKKMLPTRLARFCCKALKERGGENRVVLLGIRHEESKKRAERKMTEACRDGRRWFVSPIIDWSSRGVWAFLSGRNISHCELYDPPYGYTRIGCVLCPMGNRKGMAKDARYFPKIYRAYLNTVRQLMEMGIYANFNTPEDVMKWWMSGKSVKVFNADGMHQTRFCFDN